MNVDDSYRELGLEPGCSDAEVKAAYRRLAARWHPDRNASQQALRKIQRINRALAEIRKARAEQGKVGEGAIEHKAELTLEQFLSGCSLEIRGELVQDCAECGGSGLQPEPSACAECSGTGRIQPNPWLAWFAPPVQCGACAGRGSTRLGCAHCAATGKSASRAWRAKLDVPPASRPHGRIETRARFGRSGAEQATVRVRLVLRPHELFSVADDGTVQCTLPVDGYAWVANRWIEVPTPSGLQQMRLRRGHLNYRIKGAGMPWGADGARADCMVTVEPLFPDELDLAQEAAIDDLVAGNSGRAGSAAGARVADWRRELLRWQQRLT